MVLLILIDFSKRFRQKGKHHVYLCTLFLWLPTHLLPLYMYNLNSMLVMKYLPKQWQVFHHEISYKYGLSCLMFWSNHVFTNIISLTNFG